jgi:tetratricopeptide (TPR) repeat protein
VRKARWAALRPLPGSPPQAFIDYDYAYLGRHPTDHAALVELAANQARMGNYDGAISTYRKILEFYPADGDSKLQLAHALAVTQRYPEAIQMYRELLKQSPDDRGLLAALARVYLWANRKQEALEIDQRLLKQDPQNIQLMLRTAGLELSLNQDSEARETLATVAALDPGNRRAALGLAALDERRGDWKGARRQYRIVLSRDPHDTTALYGDARLAYYQGDMRKAWSEAKQVLNAEPNNVDAMLLAARIENAQGKWRQAKALVDRARQDAPASAEVGEMQQTLSREALATIHTSSTYAREVGPLTSYFSPQGVLNFRIPNEDLNAYSNAVTIGLPLLFPHSQSYFSFASMPSNSPRGVIRGAVAPSEFEYRQSTDLAPFLTLRGGIGIERFGPGNGVIIPNITFPTRPATFVPITEFAGVGYGGFTLRPTSRLSLDLDISRDGVAYTPLTVRFGVIQVRKQVGLNYQADHRDQVHITYYHDNFNSSLFDRVSNFNSQFVGLGPYGVDKATGGTLDYDRTLIQSTNFSLDGGYSGEAFGYTGPSRGVYMGFFNPAFYQRHFAVVNGQGRLWGPLSFSFGAGFGLQQLGNQQPLIAAYQLNPNLKIQVNSRFSITLGYIRYNFGQSLGPLTGNAVQISTDSKFW